MNIAAQQAALVVEARADRAPDRLSWYEILKAKLADKSAVVGVCGLGYVGLPLVRAIGGKGFKVLGFDVDDRKVEQINAGKSYIRHIASESIGLLVEGGVLQATSDFARVKDADVLLICVPTPLNRHREPDLSFVVSTARSIAAYAQPGQLIILESTTYPGTTDDVVAPIFAEAGLIPGENLFLAFSPEREDPGNSDFST
jgi:UDP-N-acetyl-D-glucosamine dehydrogenase